MSRRGKFGKQAARGRRTFGNNLYRALSGLNIAALPDDEQGICRPTPETVQDKVARLRAHLEVYGNDGDARQRYQELTGLPWLAGEVLMQPALALETPIISRGGPEFLGIGGGQNRNSEVYIPGGETPALISEDEWFVLARMASLGITE